MKYGEIVELGRHRLMCGDATRAEDVSVLVGSDRVNLVLTDPPYGMKRLSSEGFTHGKSRNCWIQPSSYAKIIGDDSRDTARLHYQLARLLTNRLIIWGGQYFADFLPVNGGWIFWDKLTGNNDFSDGELAWCSFGKRVRKYVHLWNGTLRQGTYRLNPKPRVHPTQKPVELHARILEDFSQPEDIILDCFGGSGTTLIACEITGRRCLMMELSPDYCNIIINRYKSLTEGQIFS